MVEFAVELAMLVLGIDLEIAAALHMAGGDSGIGQGLHRFPRLSLASPGGEFRIDRVMGGNPPVDVVKRRVACPLGVAEYFAKSLPLIVVFDRDREPFVVSGARISALGRSVEGSVAVSREAEVGGLAGEDFWCDEMKNFEATKD